MNWIEIIGWIGSAFVLLSFLMTQVKWIRILNMVGCVVNIVYGALTNTWATLGLNAALLIIHAVYLIRLYLKNKKTAE